MFRADDYNSRLPLRPNPHCAHSPGQRKRIVSYEFAFAIQFKNNRGGFWVTLRFVEPRRGLRLPKDVAHAVVADGSPRKTSCARSCGIPTTLGVEIERISVAVERARVA